jgi:hypothetical protein
MIHPARNQLACGSLACKYSILVIEILSLTYTNCMDEMFTNLLLH